MKDFRGSYEYSLLPDDMKLLFELFYDDSAIYVFRHQIIIRPIGANWIIFFKKLSNFPHLMDVSGDYGSGSVLAIIIDKNLNLHSSIEYKIAVFAQGLKIMPLEE